MHSLHWAVYFLTLCGALGFSSHASPRARSHFLLAPLSSSPANNGATTTLDQASVAKTRTHSSKPPRELPPVFSEVIKNLPMPFSDITPGNILSKLWGNRPIHPLVKILTSVVGFGLVFPPLVRLQAALFWPLHLRLRSMLGPQAALFITYTAFNISSLPVALGLMLPMVTPTAPEYAPEAKKIANSIAQLVMRWQFLGIYVVGSILPVLLIVLSTPAHLVETPLLPSLSFWPLCTTGLFCIFSLDTTYYFLHRVWHISTSKNPLIKWLYKSHKFHHSCDVHHMNPLDSSRLAQVELVQTNTAIMMGSILLGIFGGGLHPAVSMSFQSFCLVQAFIAHSGHFQHDGGVHTLHHQRNNVNYSLTGLWDYVFGTSQSSSIDTMYKLAGMYQLTSTFKEEFKTDSAVKVSHSDAVEISALMPLDEYEPGEAIINQGDFGDEMYILEEGTCSAFVDGKEVFVYDKAGEYFGELALLNNEPRKASVIAGDLGATVSVVNRPLFDRVVEKTGDFMRKQASIMYS